MGKEHDLWVEDIADLKSLGNVKIRNVSQDLANASSSMAGLRIDPRVFGEGSKIGHEIASGYEDARGALADKTKDAGEKTDKVADAVVAIAKHYEDVDRKLA